MIEGIPWPGAYLYSRTIKPRIRLYEMMAEEIVSKTNSGRILDVGTGPGTLPIEIAKRAPDMEVIGIDISKTMVKIARKNAEKEGVSDRVKFEAMSAYELKFDDGYFDMVISSGALHHFNRPKEAFNEIYRVLKPGKEAWIYDLIRDASSEEMKRFLKSWSISTFPWKIAFRLHGLKYDEYMGRIAKAIEESNFDEYEFEKRDCLMKVVLRKP